jgi:diacylglycerol kinase (ATP)
VYTPGDHFGTPVCSGLIASRLPNFIAVRTCVIFNPTAKGDKARRFRRHLDEIRKHAELKLTTAVGDGRKLAARAVEEGFEIVVAAGGDGTVNEVLNGIGDAPQGFEKAALGVLRLGTVNVFARELGLSSKLQLAWDVILKGKETRIDLPSVEYAKNGATSRHYFVQMAGAGLDARAIELVQWSLKKRIGPLAYVVAGFQALAGEPSKISTSDGSQELTGGMVLVGNGRLYGGDFRIFPRADLRDGLLEVCVLPRTNWMTLARCAPPLLWKGTLPASAIKAFQSASFTLTSPVAAPLEVDGELVGHLPAKFTIERSRLRVIVP